MGTSFTASVARPERNGGTRKGAEKPEKSQKTRKAPERQRSAAWPPGGPRGLDKPNRRPGQQQFNGSARFFRMCLLSLLSGHQQPPRKSQPVHVGVLFDSHLYTTSCMGLTLGAGSERPSDSKWAITSSITSHRSA